MLLEHYNDLFDCCQYEDVRIARMQQQTYRNSPEKRNTCIKLHMMSFKGLKLCANLVTRFFVITMYIVLVHN